METSRGDNVQGILDTIGPFWAKWGLGRVPLSASFFLVNHATFQQLHNSRLSPNLVTKRILVSHRRIQKDIFENVHFRGHLPPKSEIENRSNRHLTQSRSQDALQRYILYSTCSPRAREFPKSGQLFCTTYSCGATRLQSCPIFGFWPIFPIQNP